MSYTPNVERWRSTVQNVLGQFSSLPPSTCPSLILALIQNESGGDSDAIGADGEVGLLQVLTREYAIRAGWPNPDGRPPAEELKGNPSKQIWWGVKILTDYYRANETADWFEAVLAFKCGLGGIDSAPPAKLQGTRSVFGWAMCDMGWDPWEAGRHAVEPVTPPGGRCDGEGSDCIVGSSSAAGNGSSSSWKRKALVGLLVVGGSLLVMRRR